MATTVSAAYFPTHLARLARCSDSDDDVTQSATSASVVSRARERLTLSQRQRAALAKPASRSSVTLAALDNGLCTKVEEVRRKLEEQANRQSFSRSFESPPRRRLADSLFASFKLPRRQSDSAMAVSRVPPPTPHHHSHRKSAVELLAESKAFYVKSETVLDRKQGLPTRIGVVQNTAVTSHSNYGTGTLARDGLTSALRRLLDSNDSRRASEHKENNRNSNSHNEIRASNEKRRNAYSFHETYQMPKTKDQTSHLYQNECQRRIPDLVRSLPHPYQSIDRRNPREITQSHKPGMPFIPDMSRIPRMPEMGRTQDLSRFKLPESSLIAIDNQLGRKQKFPDLGNLPDYGTRLHHSFDGPITGHIDDCYYVRDYIGYDVETFPPPDAYKEPDIKSPQRSVHTLESFDESGSIAMDCGTISPPEQYSHRRYASQSSQNINSHKSLPDLHTHSSNRSHRTVSCSSRTNSGRSRGSVVSSCEAFSDDQSNTDGNRRWWTECGGSSGRRTHHSAPPQRNLKRESPDAWVSVEFQPPPQFQDDPSAERYDSINYTDEVLEPAVDGADYNNQGVGETSPLGQFKRQRGLRFKQRKARPILRSKSDISDRYGILSNPTGELDRFFTQLGLDDATYRELFAQDACQTPSPPSSRASPPLTRAGPSPPRPGPREPGVVERNARVIKWLCHCKKVLGEV